MTKVVGVQLSDRFILDILHQQLIFRHKLLVIFENLSRCRNVNDGEVIFLKV